MPKIIRAKINCLAVYETEDIELPETMKDATDEEILRWLEDNHNDFSIAPGTIEWIDDDEREMIAEFKEVR